MVAKGSLAAEGESCDEKDLTNGEYADETKGEAGQDKGDLIWNI